MAYRSSSNVAYVTATTTTVPVCSGAAVDDVALVGINTDVNVTTSLAGWALLAETPFITSGFVGRFRVFGKRLTSGDLTGPWVFTHSGSTGSVGEAAVWSGRATTGNPFDFTYAAASGNTINGPPRVGGLATAGTDMAVLLTEWNGNTAIGMSGYTQPVNTVQGVHLFYSDNATGGTVPAVTGAGATQNSWWVSSIGIRAAAAPAGVQGPFDLGFSQTASGQYATTLPVDVPSGATITVGSICTTGMNLAISDSKSGSWTAAGTADTSAFANPFILNGFYCKTTTAYAAGDTITVTRTNGVTPNLLAIHASYYTGVSSIRGAAASGSGVTSATNGENTTLSPAAVTTIAGDRVWTVVGSNATPSITASGSDGQSSFDSAMYSSTTRSLFVETRTATGTSTTPVAQLVNNQAAARTWGALALAMVPSSSSASYTASGTDSVTVTESVSRTAAASRSLTDSVAAIDVVTRTSARGRSVSEILGVVDNPAASAAAVRSIIDSVTLSEVISRSQGTQTRGVAESLSAADTASATSTHSRSVSDSLTVIESAARVHSANRSALDALGVIDETTASVALHSGVEDSVTFSEAISLGGAIAVSDQLTITEAVTSHASATRTVGDVLGVAESAARISHAQRSSEDILEITEVVEASGTHGGVSDITDSVSITDAAAASVALNVQVSDGLVIAETTTHGIGTRVTDNVSITEAVSTGAVSALSETLGVVESVSSVLTLFAAVDETLNVAELVSLAGSSSIFVTDSLILTESLSAVFNTGITPYVPGPAVPYVDTVTPYEPGEIVPYDNSDVTAYVPGDLIHYEG